MNEIVKAAADWMRSTDLAEISYRKNGAGFSLTAAGYPRAEPSLPSSRFIPVISQGVGIFQWSEPGRPRKSDEGTAVAAGDVLGVIVTGSGAAKPIESPRSGRVSKIFVEAGQAVEYGQPILLLES